MGTFGTKYTGGDNIDRTVEDLMNGGVYAVPSGNNIIPTSITAKIRCDTVAKKMKCAIYGPTSADETSPYVWTFIASTEEKSIAPSDTVYSWHTFSIPAGSRPTLTAGESYYLCLFSEAGAGNGKLRGRTVAESEYAWWWNTANYVDGFPLTTSAGRSVTTFIHMFIYCTYEAASDPVSPPTTASGLWPREFFISGYLPRYQKRQIVGYHSASGDLRDVEVNASGHLFTDIEVIVSSGLPVVVQSGLGVLISGQHVFVESGVHVVADIAESGIGVQVQSGAHVIISGQPVTVSGDHVFVESGVHVVIESGVGVTATVVTDVSGQPIHVGCADTIRTGKLVQVLGGTSGSATAGSGGMSLCVSGYWCSGPIHTIIVKNIAGNDSVYIGEVNCKPYSGYGFLLAEKEAINLDYCDVCDVYVFAQTSGQYVTWIGTDY